MCQEATIRTRNRITDWFQIWKEMCIVYIVYCIFSPCLFKSYSEYIMQNAGLGELQAGIKITGRNNNNFRYIDDTTQVAESESVKVSHSGMSDSL